MHLLLPAVFNDVYDATYSIHHASLAMLEMLAHLTSQL